MTAESLIFQTLPRFQTIAGVGSRLQELPALPGEGRLEVCVGELRIRDGELAAELESLLRPDRVETLVGLRVDARDEEARHRMDLRRVAADHRADVAEPALTLERRCLARRRAPGRPACDESCRRDEHEDRGHGRTSHGRCGHALRSIGLRARRP